VQVWSGWQDRRALLPLRILRPPLLPVGARLAAARWAYGRQHGVSAATAIELARRLENERMNLLQVRSHFGSHRPAGNALVMSRLAAWLYIGPTSTLWADTRGYTGTSRQAECARMSFESKQSVSRRVMNWPTSVRAKLELVSDRSFVELQRALLPVLVRAVADLPFGSALGGCADLFPTAEDEADPDCYPMAGGVQVTVGHGRRVFDVLRSRWDALHPFMIGPYMRCARLCRLLGLPTRLRKAGSRKPEQSFGVAALLGQGWFNQRYRFRPGEPGW
jgi:hypothetical protein